MTTGDGWAHMDSNPSADHFIGRWLSQYQVLGAASAAPAVKVRLDRLLREQAMPVYDAALTQFLEDDKAVYVIRRIDFRLNLAIRPSSTDAELAREWGMMLAKVVVNQVLDGENLVRFEDPADYVAHFAGDLIAGRAWANWVYESFSDLRPLSVSSALRATLLADIRLLPAILARLGHLRTLEGVLQELTPAARQAVWAAVASRPTDAGLAGLGELARPLFAAASRFAHRLDLWARKPPELETLLPLLADWSPPDWHDPHALSVAVLDILGVLVHQGYVHRPSEQALLNLDSALRELDWLDTASFQTAFESLTRKPWPADSEFKSPSNLQQGIASRVTPHQQRLLSEILAVVKTGGLALDATAPESENNAIRLLAALVDRHPEWSGDGAVTELISRLLAAWAMMMQSHNRVSLLNALQQGNLNGALEQLPVSIRRQADPPLRAVLQLGKPAMQVLAELGHAHGPGAVDRMRGAREIETASGGIALLLRALLDARLPALITRTGYPNPALKPDTRLWAVLLPVFHYWAGDSTVDERTTPIDGESPVTPDEIREPEMEQWDEALSFLAGAGAEQEALGFRNWQAVQSLWMQDSDESRRVTEDFLKAWEKQLRGLGLTQFNSPDAIESLSRDQEIALLGESLLRLWSRWLRNFAHASLPFLRAQFIRRQGILVVAPTEIQVELERRPLDVVLEMAGYLDPVERVSWLGDRKLVIKLM